MILRERFPIFREKVYLNSCSQGALSTDVMDAFAAYLRDWQERGSPWDLWVEKLEAARASFAGLVNAAPDAVAVTSSVSAAVSAIASGLAFDGDRTKVVITDFDFPTTAQIWHAQRARGAQIVQVKGQGSWIDTEAIDAAIDEQTLLVSIPHVCYRNGALLDIAGIVEAAHRKGALVLVDSYQALGSVPIDVTALNVDFLVGGVLKYLLAPAGLAYAYVRPSLITDLQPTVTGWFGQADIFAMRVDAHDPSPTARRLESGTPPVPILYAATAGIDLIRSVGVETIAVHIGELTGALKAGIQAQGFELASPAEPDRHGAMIAVRAQDVGALVNRLGEAGIVVSSRDNNLRISPHLYNNLDDIHCLLDALARNRALLCTEPAAF